jgi:hypothetical protein
MWPLGALPSLEYCYFVVINLWLKFKRRLYKNNFIRRNPGKLSEFERSYRKRARKLFPHKWRARDKAAYSQRRNQKLAHKKRNKDEINKVRRELRKRHGEIIRGREKKQYRKEIQNPGCRIVASHRARICRLVRKNGRKTMHIIGCTRDELMAHLQSKFQPGMAWNNYGQKGWHVDHIIPISKFNFSDPSQVTACFHWSNLQPLWWYQNLEKHNKIGPEYGNVIIKPG